MKLKPFFKKDVIYERTAQKKDKTVKRTQ